MGWRDLPEETAERFDLPADAVVRVPKITITGKARVLVENHKGLLSYTEDCVEIHGGRTRVCIRGNGLELRAMDRNDLIITGQILSVEFQ